MELTRETPLAQLPGVGPAKSGRLLAMGLATVGDLLGHFPRRYEDRREICSIAEAPEDRPCCVTGMVAEPPRLSRVRKGLDLVKVRVVDGGGVMEVTFFNQSYIRTALRVGESYVFYGVAERSGRRRAMTNPAFEREGTGRSTGLILPVYPLTAGVSNSLLAGLTRMAVEEALDGLTEILPERVRLDHQLCQVEYAYRNIHYPPSFEELAIARRRLVFEELFVLTCALAMLKDRRGRDGGRVLTGRREEFEGLLPFAPTGAQRQAMDDIAADLSSGRAMNRLVQGDVGSGKTAVATFGGWLAAKNGCQCAMMAPTELLAEQHYRTLSGLLGPAGVRVGLLTGAVTGGERRKLLSAVAAGEIDLLVGTHALFSGGVAYHDLALVIADEQHRFGVAQRAALAEKGAERGAPHVLFMSATPIPRTLALIIYGDLDVSVIDELPPGRVPAATYVVGEDKRQRMWGFVRKRVAEGRQVYIVCPAVEETEPLPQWDEADRAPMDLKAVTTYAKDLRERVFPDLRVGLVHGKLKPKEKEAVMSAFAAGELDILVATTVIEVGVDVPNATLMIVENADRFGLSQLHQLRGRVGRGGGESWCILVTSSRGENARERLRTLCATSDGFQVAEEDLRLRGPGDFFGSRQHGLPQLKVADFASDVALLQEAKEAAEELIREDPELTAPDHRALRERAARMFRENGELFN